MCGAIPRAAALELGLLTNDPVQNQSTRAGTEYTLVIGE